MQKEQYIENQVKITYKQKTCDGLMQNKLLYNLVVYMTHCIQHKYK